METNGLRSERPLALAAGRCYTEPGPTLPRPGILMRRLRCLVGALALLACGPRAQGGLYYSGEVLAELPSQWQGFLLDQRLLRSIALRPTANGPVSAARRRYKEAADRLKQAARRRALSADEQADLGALYVRLGDIPRALSVLRAAERADPTHFRIAANLGTAWQLQGDNVQAARALREAVRLAPGKYQRAEEFHLKLVQLRQRAGPGATGLDDLFGVRYAGDGGRYEPGRLAAAERKKLPSDAVPVCQLLALWLPADGRLLWQLAELANAHGDVRTAAAMMDGCVTEFGLHDPELRRHRRTLRAAADAPAAGGRPNPLDPRATHRGHAGGVKPRSRRPLQTPLDRAALPPIRTDGPTPLPWAVIGATTLDRRAAPAFPAYLRELDGKEVTLSGYMQPLGDSADLTALLLVENPIGCWYCEMPDLTGIVLVRLADGTTAAATREQIKITGRLRLNATDPESFLYTITKATVAQAD